MLKIWGKRECKHKNYYRRLDKLKICKDCGESISDDEFYDFQGRSIALEIINAPTREQSQTIVKDWATSHKNQLIEEDRPLFREDVGKFYIGVTHEICNRGTVTRREILPVVYASGYGLIPGPKSDRIPLDILGFDGKICDYVNELRPAK